MSIMAKTRGIIHLEGRLDGLSFYNLKGVGVVRRPGGFNGKRIKTDPAMVRVRENGSEFGQCSKANKAFRVALRPFYAGHRFSYFHSRLQGLFTNIKNLDTVNARGVRTVAQGLETTEGSRLLQGFAYTPDNLFISQRPFAYSFDWDSQVLSITDFYVAQMPFIKGSTHLQLRLGVLDFDFEGLAYRLELSEPLVIDRSFTANTFDLAPEIVQTLQYTGVAILGIQYFQEVNGELLALQREQAIGFGVVSML